jgi:serine/threonine protein kinase
MEDVLLEISILKRAAEYKHNSIVEMMDCFTDSKYIYIILEMCHGGELFDAVEKYGAMTEERAKTLFRQILGGLKHMHDVLHVCHLDLSLENIFLDNEGNGKIGDFGLARELKNQETDEDSMDDDLLCSSAAYRPGKSSYMSPEIVECGPFHGRKADVFAAGVILFVLLFGFPPFDHANADSDIRYELISNNRLLLLLQKWKLDRTVSPHAIDLIQQMLLREPSRISLDEALSHGWFTEL